MSTQSKAAKPHKIKTVFWNLIAVGALSAWCVPAAFAEDRDNNAPGPPRGPGANWESPPGPIGGPGTSPNTRRGCNWFNPPVPIGRPGAGVFWHLGSF